VHGGKITRANLVTAMATAAAVDLDGRQILPLLFASLGSSPEPPVAETMLSALQQWLNDGALRRKASAGASQYADASAVAIMDQLARNLERALFDRIFSASGVFQVDGADAGYNAVPLQFQDWPHGNGTHHGSSYQDGWTGYVVKVLEDLNGTAPATPLSSDTTSRVCGAGGLSACHAAIDSALVTTADQLTAANGTATVSSWTNDVASHNAGVTMPVYDDIHFEAVGIVGQPDIDWQNRPTFQQVVEFPGALSADVPEVPMAAAAGLSAIGLLGGMACLRRRSSARRGRRSSPA